MINVDLAGVPKEDIKVDVEDDILTVSGERKMEKEEEDKEHKWHRVERRFGSFQRRLQLPKGTKSDDINASSKDGVLKITIEKPKAERKKSKIEVKEGK